MHCGPNNFSSISRKNNPWELISTPFMEDSPVAPKKKQIVLLGLFTSILLGSLCAYYAERFTGIIYSLAEFRSLLNYRFLNQLDLFLISESTHKIKFTRCSLSLVEPTFFSTNRSE